MSSLAARFAAALRALPLAAGDRVLVAVSGGSDSIALLRLLVATRDGHGADLVAAHVDHGIHPDSAEVARRVETLALGLELPFQLRRLRLGPDASETAARAGRYAALAEMRSAAAADWIATAHHADDQVETVLMRLLHGSGPAGMAGMAPVRGCILRPLLAFRRDELARYVRDQGLGVWADPANADPRHERAWIRQAVIPLLEQRVPDLTTRLLRTSRLAAADRRAWDELLDCLPGLAVAPERDGISVAAPVLGGYDSPLAAAVIRAVGRRIGLVIGEARGERVLALVRRGASGSTAPLGGTARAELAFGRLRLLRGASGAPPDAAVIGSEAPAGELRWGSWVFRWGTDAQTEPARRNGMTAWFVTGAELRVRGWRSGDRIRPLGTPGRRLVVRCLQEARVARSDRAAWPVVESAGRVVWVPGVCRSAELVPELGSEALRVDAAYA